MTAIASGKSMDEISRRLDIDARAINASNASILEKLELKDNSELLNYCMEEGLL
jgi:DNA-binding NarL/FixJ family response regulator